MRIYFSNKKAMMSRLTSIILALAVFLVLTSIYISIPKKLSDSKPYLLECKLTLGLDAMTKDFSWIRNKIGNTCQTVKLDNLNDLRTPSDIKRYTANRMAQAWSITWEGKKNLWAPEDGVLGRLGGYDCMILFDLDYTHPKYPVTISQADFYSFLTKEIYSVSGTPYVEYLQGKKENGAFLIQQDITDGNNYAISILNPHRANSEVNPLLGGVAGFAIGGPVGAGIGFASTWTTNEVFEHLGDAEELNTVIVFSDLTWAEEQGCKYMGVEV